MFRYKYFLHHRNRRKYRTLPRYFPPKQYAPQRNQYLHPIHQTPRGGGWQPPRSYARPTYIPDEFGPTGILISAFAWIFRILWAVLFIASVIYLPLYLLQLLQL